MASTHQPTPQDLLLGLKRFNEWQEDQELLSLPKMTVTETLNQYFELCDLVRGWQPDPELVLGWMLEEKSLWIELTDRFLRESKG
jgi:hypothetical protein